MSSKNTNNVASSTAAGMPWSLCLCLCQFRCHCNAHAHAHVPVTVPVRVHTTCLRLYMNIYSPGMCTVHERFQYMNTYCTWNLWVNVHVHEHKYVLEIWLLLNFDQIDRFIASVRNLDVRALRRFGAFQPRGKFGSSTSQTWGRLSDIRSINFPGKQWSHSLTN